MELFDLKARVIWNQADGTIDMDRVRAADLRGNKRINHPAATAQAQEIE